MHNLLNSVRACERDYEFLKHSAFHSVALHHLWAAPFRGCLHLTLSSASSSPPQTNSMPSSATAVHFLGASLKTPWSYL